MSSFCYHNLIIFQYYTEGVLEFAGVVDMSTYGTLCIAYKNLTDGKKVGAHISTNAPSHNVGTVQ